MWLELLGIAEELNSIANRALSHDPEGAALHEALKRQAEHIEGIAGRIQRGES
jgi:hypothetical protein